jgi:CRISPR-associated exonuclease Cas4
MLNCSIPAGALFYGKTRRRHDVRFESALRQTTEAAALRLHELFSAGKTPPAVYDEKCEQCSLLNLCMPRIAGKGKLVEGYLISNLRFEISDKEKGG